MSRWVYTIVLPNFENSNSPSCRNLSMTALPTLRYSHNSCVLYTFPTVCSFNSWSIARIADTYASILIKLTLSLILLKKQSNILENWTYLSNLQFINLYIKYNKNSQKITKLDNFFFQKIAFILTLSKVSIRTEMGALSNTRHMREWRLYHNKHI